MNSLAFETSNPTDRATFSLQGVSADYMKSGEVKNGLCMLKMRFEFFFCMPLAIAKWP
jgi:hypothetical protein